MGREILRFFQKTNAAGLEQGLEKQGLDSILSHLLRDLSL